MFVSECLQCSETSVSESAILIELMKSSVKEPLWANIYGAWICMSSFVKFLAQHHWEYNTSLLGMRWKSATIGIVYKKVRTAPINFYCN